MKKILLICGLLLTATITAFAQSGTSGQLTWTIADDTLRIRVTAETGYATMNPFNTGGEGGSVTNAPWGTLANRDLFSVAIIEERVTTITMNAFFALASLTSVIIGPDVTTIGTSAFRNTGLTEIIIPNNVTSIGTRAFENTNLTSLTIPNSVTSVEGNAFLGTNLRNLVIEESTTPLIFRNTGPNVATGNGPFPVSHVDSVYMGRTIYRFTSTGDTDEPALSWTLFGIGVRYLTIGENVTSIPNNAFRDCVNLTSVIIPENVTSIGSSAFQGCTGLTTVVSLRITPPTAQANTFLGVTACLYAPSVSIYAYSTAIGWENFSCVRAFGYFVTFNSQGGTPVEPQLIEYGQKIIEPTSPTRTGFTFGGWYREANTINAWNFDTDVGTTDLTLYARWIINTYTVAFNSQSGSTVESQTIEYGETVTEPTPPTRIGFTFGGWYRESAGVNAWNFDTDVITSDTTLFAQWTINTYTVTFNSQGGTDVTEQVIEHGSVVVEPTPPTRTGFTFDGWYREAEGVNAWNFTTDVIVSDTTLFAKWTMITYTVMFNSMGGSAVNSQTIEHGKTVTEPTPPNRTGFDFEGWYREHTFVNAWDFDTDIVTANTTLYARWTEIPTFIVIFNSMGGSTVAPQTVREGETVTQPNDPTRAGFIFEGWYRESTFVILWDFDTDVVTEQITLYARWRSETTNIAELYDSQPIQTWVSNGVLHIEGLPIGERYRIFSISGTLIRQGVVNRDIVEIPLSVRGVYIIQSGSWSVRVVY